MPEYLAPGVYVEEVSFRSKSIEGVPTSTTGFAGLTRFGPVQYVDNGRRGPRSTEPRLITSFTEFERVYGGLEQLRVDRGDGQPTSEAYLAHAARAFFLNGGKRLYVSRVFTAVDTGGGVLDWGIASRALPFGVADNATWRARWPGAYGNALIKVRPVRKRNSAYQHATFGTQASGLARGAVVEVTEPPATPPAAGADVTSAALGVVDVDDTAVDAAGNPQQIFRDSAGAVIATTAATIIKEVVLQVVVQPSDERVDVYDELATHPAQRRWVGKILQADDPEDESAALFLDTAAPDDPAVAADLTRAIDLMVALQTVPEGVRLSGGNDGGLPGPAELLGDEADPDDANVKATGVTALGEIDDIAIVATPDAAAYDDVTMAEAAARNLITHAEALRYRIAVVDAPRGSSMNEIRDFRGKFDTTRRSPVPPVDRDLRPTRASRPGSASAAHPAAALGLRHRHLRPQRHHARRLQGAGERGRARSDEVRGEHQHAAQRRTQPRGHQCAALLRGPRQPRLGSPHDVVGPRVEVRERTPPVHLPRALHRQGHAVGRVRAEQRAAVEQHPPDGRGLPLRAVAQRGAARGDSRRRPTSSAATAPR